MTRQVVVTGYGTAISKYNSFIFSDKELLMKYPRLDKSCQYALEATSKALECARISKEKLKEFKTAVIIGTTFGTFDSQERFLKVLKNTGKPSSIFFQQTAKNLLSGIIAYKYNLTDYNTTIYNGITAGVDAIILAQSLIASKRVDMAIIGGVDISNETIQNHYYENSQNHNSADNGGAGILIIESQASASEGKRNVIGKLGINQQGMYHSFQQLKEDFGEIIKKSSKFECCLTNISEADIEKIKLGNSIDVERLSEESASSIVIEIIDIMKSKRKPILIFCVGKDGNWSSLNMYK